MIALCMCTYGKTDHFRLQLFTSVVRALQRSVVEFVGQSGNVDDRLGEGGDGIRAREACQGRMTEQLGWGSVLLASGLNPTPSWEGWVERVPAASGIPRACWICTPSSETQERPRLICAFLHAPCNPQALPPWGPSPLPLALCQDHHPLTKADGSGPKYFLFV